MSGGSGGGGGRPARTVFVTVGTTKFDALIRAVDQQAVADALVARGYTRLVMQVLEQRCSRVCLWTRTHCQ